MLAKAMLYLEQGHNFIKSGKRGMPKPKQVALINDRILWREPLSNHSNQKKFILIREIKEIQSVQP
jgi:hypothetical protein